MFRRIASKFPFEIAYASFPEPHPPTWRERTRNSLNCFGYVALTLVSGIRAFDHNRDVAYAQDKVIIYQASDLTADLEAEYRQQAADATEDRNENLAVCLATVSLLTIAKSRRSPVGAEN